MNTTTNLQNSTKQNEGIIAFKRRELQSNKNKTSNQSFSLSEIKKMINSGKK